jgi:hypothetical protein
VEGVAGDDLEGVGAITRTNAVFDEFISSVGGIAVA